MALYRNNIYQWEGDNTQPYPVLFTWTSGVVLLPQKKTFYCARVIAETGDRQTYFEQVEARMRAIKRNTDRLAAGLYWDQGIGESVINGDDLEEVPIVADYSGNFRLLVKIYGDNILLHEKQIYANDRPFTIKGGIRARSWYVVITGNVKVRQFDMADAMSELMLEGE